MRNCSFIVDKFWYSEKVASCSHSARLMLIGIVRFAENGYHHKKCYKSIKVNIFPGDEVSDADIDLWINELISVELIKEIDNHKEFGNCWEITPYTRHLLILSVPEEMFQTAQELSNQIANFLDLQMDN